MSEGNRKGGKACFKQEKRDRRSGEAAGDDSARRAVEGFEGLKVFSVNKGKPTRGSVRQDGQKKGPIDRSQGLFGGSPVSGSNSPERFQTGPKSGSQGRTMWVEGKSAV